MAKSFKQQVGAWVSESEKRLLAVQQQSIEEVVTRAQRPIEEGGSMPVVTGNLRKSLIVAINGMKAGKGEESHINAIPLMRPGDTVFIGWTAEYARRMEYGFTGTDSLGRSYNQQGYGFLRQAVQKWGQIVRDNARSFERAFRR